MLRVADVAARWQLDRSTVYRMCADGRLPCVRRGDVVRIPAAQLEAIERGDECQGPTKVATSGETPAPASTTSAGLLTGGDTPDQRAAAIRASLGMS